MKVPSISVTEVGKKKATRHLPGAFPLSHVLIADASTNARRTAFRHTPMVRAMARSDNPCSWSRAASAASSAPSPGTRLTTPRRLR